MTNRKIVNAKVVSTGKNQVPFDFPWRNGVNLHMIEDVTKLDGMIKEMKEIKAMINKDISKFGMNLKDFEITLEFKGI